jgi:hypothetical protein
MFIRPLLVLCALPCLIAWAVIPCSASADHPELAAMGQELVRQLESRPDYQVGDRADTAFIVATPTSLDNLSRTSPLARITAENLSLWLVRQGFTVRELRRSAAIHITPGQGEIGLTRRPEWLDTTPTTGALLVTGTYTVQSDRVLFHIRVLAADSTTILAMAPLEVPRSRDTDLLLTRNDKRGRTFLFAPSVKTSLPAY